MAPKNNMEPNVDDLSIIVENEIFVGGDLIMPDPWGELVTKNRAVDSFSK